MVHISVQDLKNGYFKLTPETGYSILDTRTQQAYRQVTVKDVKPFRAIEL